MMHTQKFYPKTILFTADNDNQLTVAMALKMIDSFLSYLTVAFNVNTEPYSTAVKVANAMINVLNNRPAKKITEQDLEIFIDAWESAVKQRYPNDRQQITLDALLCKFAINLAHKNN